MRAVTSASASKAPSPVAKTSAPAAFGREGKCRHGKGGKAIEDQGKGEVEEEGQDAEEPAAPD